MEWTKLVSESDYLLALKRINALMDAEPNTKEFDELDILVAFVEDYEAQHYKIE